jgi:hypothetical protein
MAVTSGWDLGSQADREAGWDQTVPLSVAGVTRRGPVDGSDVPLRPCDSCVFALGLGPEKTHESVT